MGISADGELVDFEGAVLLDAPDKEGDIGVSSSAHGFFVSLRDLREFVARHSEPARDPASKKKAFLGEAVIRSKATVSIRAKAKFGARARFDKGEFEILDSQMLDWELVGSIKETE